MEESQWMQRHSFIRQFPYFRKILLKPQSNIFIFWLGSILWDLRKFREAEAIEYEVLEW
jgi:hypothetical protein